MRRIISIIALTLALVVPAAASAEGGDGAALSACHYRAFGALPSKVCTPGALNPQVTQATIRSTICVPGYTAGIRPHDLYTQKLTAMHDYGVANTRMFEYDHLIPLELGGAPSDPKNLWPEPYHVLRGKAGDQGAYSKDHVENYLRVQVCAGTVTLARAQALIRRDWRTAEAG